MEIGLEPADLADTLRRIDRCRTEHGDAVPFGEANQLPVGPRCTNCHEGNGVPSVLHQLEQRAFRPGSVAEKSDLHSGSSSSRERETGLPRRDQYSIGGRPEPGRWLAMSPGRRMSPAFSARAATRLLRAIGIFQISESLGVLTPSPSASSIRRIAKTMRLKSAGSSEAAWSGPSALRSSVRCFSMMLAPRATAAIAISMPSVWSEYPTASRNVRRIVCIAARLTSADGHGYSVVQCRRLTCRARCLRAPG